MKVFRDQQKTMYETRNHSISNRIYSISQLHVRPIVRGKTNALVEFGVKVSISVIDGYAFVDRLGWDAYNEECFLIPAVENYRNTYSFYPAAVLADKICKNCENISYCKARGIHPRDTLGRPTK